MCLRARAPARSLGGRLTEILWNYVVERRKTSSERRTETLRHPAGPPTDEGNRSSRRGRTSAATARARCFREWNVTCDRRRGRASSISAAAAAAAT